MMKVASRLDVIILIMKAMKNQGKTWNSQQSDIDHFAKLENSFLQKFLKHLLTDTLQHSLISLSDQLTKAKIPDRSAKSLSHDLFEISQTLSIDSFIRTIRDFINPKSPSFIGGQLQRIIQLKYINCPAQRNELSVGELAVVQVKIRLDIQKIEELPKLIQQRIKAVTTKAGAGCPVTELFHNYMKDNLNFIIIYFGEFNFQLVRKQHYKKQEIQLLGRKYKLRIFTIFISKLSLIQTFRNINKIQHPQCINDLTIQVYEMKRQRAKRKKQKKQAKARKNQQEAKKQRYMGFLQNLGVRAMIGIAVVGVGIVAIKKFFT